MNPTVRKTLTTGAITMLIASPAWAGSDVWEPPTETPQAQPGQPMENDPAFASPDPAVADNPLYTRTPEELHDLAVLDLDGERVGKVKKIVLEPDRERAHAVISMGGFAGFGTREVVVSLDEIHLVDDGLQLSITQENLEARGDYAPEQYVELKPETPISEFSAFEPIPEAHDQAHDPEDPYAPQERY